MIDLVQVVVNAIKLYEFEYLRWAMFLFVLKNGLNENVLKLKFNT